MKSTFLALFALVLGLLNFSGAWARQGGEIGNGRYVDYSNRLSGIAVKYPKNWQQFDLGSLLTLSEPAQNEPESHPGSVSIRTEMFTEIQTTDDLRKYLQFFQGEYVWTPTEINDKPGFDTVQGRKRIIYILREPGVISSIRITAGTTGETARDVEVVLESLHFSSPLLF